MRQVVIAPPSQVPDRCSLQETPHLVAAFGHHKMGKTATKLKTCPIYQRYGHGRPQKMLLVTLTGSLISRKLMAQV
ncbi:unnamed protein product [Trifolium pratense]|uniref:Uncharacterized protein n=1 Tax=Trifolium pratense TaxID=57577 RepID=A0ACB0LB98_TRIPR|nr:unnamed protein product [Trifolium pratense]